MSALQEYYSPRYVLRWVREILRMLFWDVKAGFWVSFKLGLTRLTGEPVTVTVRRTGHRFKVLTSLDVWTIDEIFVRDEYRPDKLILPLDATVIDIGGNIGGFAIWIGERYPDSTIYSYEPFPDNVALLYDNLRLNHVGNVNVIPHAVAGKIGPVTLNVSLRHNSMHSIVTDRDLGDEAKTLCIQATTLDAIIRENGIDLCDLLKLDCEGAEYDILLNTSSETLIAIHLIAMEYHDNLTSHTHHELVQLLEDHGFIVEVQDNPAIMGAGYLFATNRRF